MNNNKFRADFPQLQIPYRGKKLYYLDNAATTLKPKCVIDRITKFYAEESAPVHRGIYELAEQLTMQYEQARETVRSFLNAAESSEIVFTSGTTDSINMVAFGWAIHHLHKDDEIILTELEHHSNLIPWQEVCKRTGAKLKFIPVNLDGTLDYSSFDQVMSKKTKLVAATHCSNAIGTHVDVKKIGTAARAVGAAFLIDAAQTIAHQKIDVTELQCDFLAFSGHKMYGPTGIGVLYVNKKRHNELSPVRFGGGIVQEVNFQTSKFLPPPRKLEAGTPPVASVLGLAEAILYLKDKLSEIQKEEERIVHLLYQSLETIKNIQILGTEKNSTIISFVHRKIHAHDIAAYLDTFGITVRAGTHCAQPLAQKLVYSASVRVSIGCYNTKEEIELFIQALSKLERSSF